MMHCRMKIIHEVFEKFGPHKAHELLNEILEKGITLVKDVPECMQQLFANVETVPVWLNEDLLESGSAFCRRTGPFGLVVLRNYCLMGGYESSAINKPLIYTSALKKGASKRMVETLDFGVDVTGKGAMKKNSPGFKSAVKVRIMHAFARVSIRKVPTWSDETWGVPINHGDMIATNLGFSLVFIEGLRKLGFKPKKIEVDGIFHLWKYIGYLLGIPASHLPDNEKQAIECLYKWTMTQPVADEDTKALAIALMNEPLLSSYLNAVWKKKILIKIHLGYSYFFLGKRACQRMSLPKTSFRYFPYGIRFFNTIHEHIILLTSSRYNRSVRSGRKDQENIRILFLKGYSSLQDKNK